MTAEAAVNSRAGIPRSQWRVIILSSLGGALEFYDFVVYSTFAQYIGAAFFPASNPLGSLMRSFAVFAAGYLARPLGGIVFSHFGDRYGRRRVFIIAMLVMSSATVGMGLLPPYAKVGLWATFGIVALRLVQGFCLGGELPGAITYVVETAPRRAGFASGFIFFCVNTGVALASGLGIAVQRLLTPDQVERFGWRIGFLFGGVCGLISFYLRLSLSETEEFKRMRHAAARRPLLELLRTLPVPVFVAIGSMIATAGFNGLFFMMPAFLPQVMHYPALDSVEAQFVGLVVLSFGLLTTAWLGDRIPRRWILGSGGLLLATLAFPFFNALEAHSTGLIALFIFAGLAASFVNGPMCGVVGDLFPTRIRFSGVAVSFNLAFTLFSGPAPVVSTALVKATGSPASPAYVMLVCAGITFLASLFVKRYEGRILEPPAGSPEPAAVVSAPSFPAH